MASIYESVKSAEELVKMVSMQGFSTKQEDIVRAQDIFGRSSVDELVRLAHDNGRMDGPNGNPDHKGSWSCGRTGLSAYFYMVLFQIWHWEDATRFYNKYSNPEFDELKETEKKYKEECEKHSTSKKLLEDQKEQTGVEHQRYLAECKEKLDSKEEVKKLKAEVHDLEMTVMELKAKLYDMIIKAESKTDSEDIGK